MRALVIGEGVDLNVAASQTAVDLSAANKPFRAGSSAVAVFEVSAAPGTSFDLEGREDSTGAFSVIAQVVTADGAGTFFKNITTQQEVRLTVVGTAGVGEVGSVTLLQN